MLSYAEAINSALRRALEEIPQAILFGEDVAKPGGVHGVTRRPWRDFGDRVFDTPISESAILGGAIGAALVGLRPIVEIMWADFTFVAFDQIINQAADVLYLSRGRLSAPVTVRMQQGATPGSCAQHSQCIEALLAHIPGIRVCMPTTVHDAYELTLASIACDDPAIVIEHRALYQTRGEVSTPEAWPSIGRAATRRTGQDMTVVTWGTMLSTVLDAADHLSDQGISAEVIDPRWFSPLDIETITRSAARTRRLAIVHEANRTGGIGAEIVASVLESGVALDAPPLRIAAGDLRMPAAPTLQQAAIPSTARVVQDILKTFQ